DDRPAEIAGQLDARRDWHAGQEPNVLTPLLKDAGVLFPGAPQRDAMIVVLGEMQRNGSSPSAVPKNGTTNWHWFTFRARRVSSIARSQPTLLYFNSLNRRTQLVIATSVGS